MTNLHTEEGQKEYFNTYIVSDACDCSDCCIDNFVNYNLYIFEYFGLPFVPDIFKGREFDYGGCKDDFMYFCTKLKSIESYNIKMELKQEQSQTNKTLTNCTHCGKLTYKNKNREYQGGQLCLTCMKNYKKCHYCDTLINLRADRVIQVRFDLGKLIDVCQMCYREQKLEDHKCCACSVYAKDITNLKKVIRRRNNDDELVAYKYCKRCSGGLKKCLSFGCNELCFSGHIFCEACDGERKGLHTHDYKPIRRVFNYSSNEKNIDIESSLFFGFELETEIKDSFIDREAMAHLVKEIVGKDCVYCMTDGSLANGIEIASFPFTWDWYKKVGKDKWTELLLFLKDKGWRGDRPGEGHNNPVGFHVHTTKAAWSKLQIYKLIQFMYNPINRGFVSMAAGRPPMTFCRISTKDWDYSIMLAKNKKNVSENHYNMINLNKKSDTTKGGKTIEFRMFKGSLEPLIVHKNLEFIQAIFCFTRDYTKKEMFVENFIEYIFSNKKEYPCLSEFIRIKWNGAEVKTFNII